MTAVEWEEPKPPARGGLGEARNNLIRNECKANPGRWAVIHRGKCTRTYPRGAPRWQGFEFLSRRTAPGEYTTYIRWVGDPA